MAKLGFSRSLNYRTHAIITHGLNIFYPLFIFRECVSAGVAGARTHRFLGHHLWHPLFLRLLVLCAPADFKVQSSLL